MLLGIELIHVSKRDPCIISNICYVLFYYAALDYAASNQKLCQKITVYKKKIEFFFFFQEIKFGSYFNDNLLKMIEIKLYISFKI